MTLVMLAAHHLLSVRPPIDPATSSTSTPHQFIDNRFTVARRRSPSYLWLEAGREIGIAITNYYYYYYY